VLGAVLSPSFGASEKLILLCLGPVFAALASLLVFAVGTTLIQLLARALGGTGTYDQLTYATAAYGAPLILLGTPLSAMPYGGLFNIALGLYQLALLMVAVRAIHRLSWGKAAIPSAIALVFWAGLFALGVIVLTAVELQRGIPQA
jgi:hypothetical protein